MRRDALTAEYGQVNENFRLLSDIRFKLLAFLPIAAAAGAALASRGTTNSDALWEVGALALSLFGLAVTIGLATYNDRNDQLYDALVERAATIERALGLPEGGFAHRPYPWFTIRLGFLRWKVDHRSAVGVIYAASIALWLAVALVAAVRLVWGSDPQGWLYGAAVAAAIAIAVAGRVLIRRQRENRRKEMRRDVEDAVGFAKNHGHKVAAQCGMFLDTCARLNGTTDIDKIRRRAAFYAEREDDDLRYYMPTAPADVAATHFVALITDLPPEWISDVMLKRR